MFELMVDGILVEAANFAAIQSLRKQGKVDEETPIRKKGTEKWSRVKNLRVSTPEAKATGKEESRETTVKGSGRPASQQTELSQRCIECNQIFSSASTLDFCPTCSSKFESRNVEEPLEPVRRKRPSHSTETSRDELAVQPPQTPSGGGFSLKYWLLTAIGGTALLAILIVLAGTMLSGTPEQERQLLVGTWSVDLSDPNAPEPNTDAEKLQMAIANRMLANCTLELQRDGTAIQKIPMFKPDGSDAQVQTGTWEVAGSGASLKLKQNYAESGAWLPIRFENEDQFTLIFQSSTRVHRRNK